MFKSVSYEGFETAPDLREQAERAMPMVAEVLGFAGDRISITWKREGHEIELVIDDQLLDKPAYGLFLPDLLDHGEKFRRAVRHMHRDAAMDSLHRSVERMRKNWPAEAGV